MLDHEFDQRAKTSQEAPRLEALRGCLSELDDGSRTLGLIH